MADDKIITRIFNASREKVWYAESVKPDLKARRLIERTGSKP